MAAIIECPFCRHQCEAPPQLAGASMRCPGCDNLFTVPATPPEAIVVARRDRRLRRRGRPVRMRCPHCDAMVELCRRERRKKKKRWAVVETALAAATLAEPPAAAPLSEEAPALDASIAVPAPKPPPEVFAPLPPRRRPRDREDVPLLRPEWVVSIAVIATSAALMCAAIPRVGILVLPLAGLGLAAALLALVTTLRGQGTPTYSAAAGAYGAIVLLIAAAFPSCLGPRYYEYRQPLPNMDVARAVPKEGRPTATVPDNPDWVDASQYALQRNGVLIEVLTVRIGPAEVLGARRGEMHTLIRLRLRRTGDFNQYGRREAPPAEALDQSLDMVLTDGSGQSYPRQNLDPIAAPPSATRGSGMFPVSLTDTTVAFAAAAPTVDGLRLEISGPVLGSGPLRFSIPGTMITWPGQSSGRGR